MQKATQIARTGMVVSGLLGALKIGVGLVGHSAAVTADGFESAADVFTSGMVLVGMKIAARPPDENHPYGHGKAEPLAATLVSLALFAAAVTIAIESMHEIRTPHSTPAAWTLIVLVGVVLVKEGLFRYVIQVGHSVQSTAVKTDAWHHRADAITSALAFVGISVAIIGGKGWESADDWAALLASGIIIFNAYHLIQPAVLELVDSTPGTSLHEDVRIIAGVVPGVLALEKCFVRKMGFDYYVDLHVVVHREMPVWRGHEIAHAVKDALRSAHPQIADVLVHIEPADA